MWFRRRRRRLPPPPVLLPSLDRLADLVERVVALLDELSLAPEPPAPAEPVTPDERPEQVAGGWVAFVTAPDGYRLLQREGAPPARGDALDLDGVTFLVLRLGPSPLPGDRRRCAFLERQERPRPERTFDA